MNGVKCGEGEKIEKEENTRKKINLSCFVVVNLFLMGCVKVVYFIITSLLLLFFLLANLVCEKKKEEI